MIRSEPVACVKSVNTEIIFRFSFVLVFFLLSLFLSFFLSDVSVCGIVMLICACSIARTGC